MAFSIVNVRGHWEDAGVAARGYVTFKRSQSIQDAATNTISPNDIRTAHLNSSGNISINLEATNDAGTAPANTTYKVTEHINGAKRSYSIQVLTADVAAGIELADVAPVTPGPVVLTYALASALTAEVARAEAAEDALQADIDAKPSDFLGLTDTPNAYTGQGGKVVAVKSDVSGLEFIAGGGGGGGASLSDNNPVQDGTASPGVGTAASRDDHVHPHDTAAGVGADATGTATAAVAAHAAAADPHTGYALESALGTASTHPASDFATASHGHVHGDVSDWNEAVQDTVGGMLQPSPDIDVTYNDLAGTATLALAPIGAGGSDERSGTLTWDAAGRLLTVATGWPYEATAVTPDFVTTKYGYGIDATGGDVVITLPNTGDMGGQNIAWYLRREDASANLVTFAVQGSDTINPPYDSGYSLAAQGAGVLVWADPDTRQWNFFPFMALSNGAPLADGSGDAGTSPLGSRADHVHPAGSSPTPGGIGALAVANNLSDVANAGTARTNLGLGTLATQSGTFSGTSSGTNTGDQTISDATISTSDITTNNVSTTKHGFAPKAPNDATKYLDGTGAWSVPAGGGGVDVLAVQVFS